MQKSTYISISYDKIKIIDNQSWFFVYVYVIEKWKSIPNLLNLQNVATLALGSQPKQRFARARAKRETRECGRVGECTLTLLNEFPFWELESWWTPKFLKSNRKGQNPLS
jgi:hypothetical protein